MKYMAQKSKMNKQAIRKSWLKSVLFDKCRIMHVVTVLEEYNLELTYATSQYT
jgi:hypothetical protein